MLNSKDIQIRDPFVLPVLEQKKYYLYGWRTWYGIPHLRWASYAHHSYAKPHTGRKADFRGDN